jgi:Isochorismatase family
MDSAMDPNTTGLISVGYQSDCVAQGGILRGVVEAPNGVDRGLGDTVAFIARAAETEMVTSLRIDSTGRAANEPGDNVTILSDGIAARTPGEQDVSCRNVFPLCGAVARSSEIVRDDVAVAA